jgi:lipooligosaccharide transport system ATP-binding protein
MEEAAALCDRIVFMDQGQIAAEGAPAALVRANVGREVVELRGIGADGPGRAVLERVLKAAGDLAEAHEVHSDFLLIYTTDGEGLLHRIREQGLDVEAATLRRATLEDVFLKLTGRMLRD